MKRMGNSESNKTYNPRNAKAQIPIDIDEVDSAMERYIRQKYEQRIYMNDTRPGTRQNTGSTSSDDRPPPLPPKPTGRFGFGLRKSATSPRNLTPPLSPGLGSFGQETSPPRVNKPSRVFGSNIQTSGDGLESKLATLRDMGFPDDKRNSTVLKGLNGNLDRTVEALIRLGEQNAGRSRGSTPTPPAKPSTNGLSFDRTNTAPAATSSTNPFDALDAVATPSYPSQSQQPVPSQTQQPSYEAAFAQTAPPSNSYNPFLAQTQQMQYQQPQSVPQQQQQQQQVYNYQQNPFGQQQSLEQSMQNMQLSQQQPQQPLFPNRTGGYGPTSPPYAQTNPFQQSFTPPPMPQIPEQYSSFFAPQPQYQPMSSPSSPGNPFLKSSRSQMFSPPNVASSNPFGQPASQQQGQQQQATNPHMMTQQPQVPAVQGSNPWQSQQQGMFQQQQNTQQPSFQQQQQQPQQQQQSFQQQNYQQQNYQQPGFQQYQQHPGSQQNGNPFDKNSILALYNYPQLAPQPSEPSQVPSGQTSILLPAAPASGHMNPFANGQNTAQGQPLSAAQTPGVRHVSNESVDFSGLMGGRHSPDAFSGLSASFKR
jgi:hypothetical protein